MLRRGWASGCHGPEGMRTATGTASAGRDVNADAAVSNRQIYIPEVSPGYRGGDRYAKRKTLYVPLLQFHGHHQKGRPADEEPRDPGHPVLPRLSTEVHAEESRPRNGP